MTDKLIVKDANDLDKKIPRDLIIMYQGKHYITKAGLEWKANLLFGGGQYGVTIEIVERTNPKDAIGYCLAKATLTTRGGIEFSNFGEAHDGNVSNPAMKKYMLHLAITRAECRVLRMATACGYTSIDEMDLPDQEKVIPSVPEDAHAPTPAQVKTIKQMNYEGAVPETQGEAKKLIAELATKKGTNE